MNRPITWASLLVVALAGCQGVIMGPEGGPDGTPPPANGGADGPPDPAGCAPLPARLWKLTPTQIERTVAALVGRPLAVAAPLEDTLVAGGRFSNEQRTQSMSLPHVEALLELADVVADAVAGDAPSCETAACLGPWLEAFGARAFRRPLTREELDRWSAFWDATRAGEDPAVASEVATKQVVRALVLSPHFLYRTELGADDVGPGDTAPLTGHEIAQRISYFVTDGPPDAPLLAAAASGELATPERRRAHARRLLETDDEGIRHFFREWLRYPTVVGVDRDDALFPDFGEDVARAMVAESDRFVEAVLHEEDGRLATLLAAPWTILDETLAEFYGAAPGRVDVASAARLPGILGHGSFLASRAQFREPDLVKRGLFVRTELLCGTIPPPPPDVVAVFPHDDGMSTQRERLAAHRADPDCAVCHRGMDPIGYGFGRFDAVGRYAETENGRLIDPSGQVEGLSPGTFDDGAGLVDLLAGAPEVARCLSRRAFRYSHGEADAQSSACALYEAHQALERSGGDMRELFVAIAGTELFAVRGPGRETQE